MINLKRVKILGAYLTVACALQIGLYLAMSISAERYERLFPFAMKQTALFYFDPRLGLSAFVGIFGWVSAPWVLALGLLLLSGRPLIKAYVISEVALSDSQSALCIVGLRGESEPGARLLRRGVARPRVRDDYL